MTDLATVLPERKPYDHRDDLTRLVQQRDNAIRALDEIAGAAWEVIRCYGNAYNLADAACTEDGTDPLMTLLIKVAVWQHADDSPPIVFADPDGGMDSISLREYGEATS